MTLQGDQGRKQQDELVIGIDDLGNQGCQSNGESGLERPHSDISHHNLTPPYSILFHPIPLFQPKAVGTDKQPGIKADFIHDDVIGAGCDTGSAGNNDVALVF